MKETVSDFRSRPGTNENVCFHKLADVSASPEGRPEVGVRYGEGYTFRHQE